jgi:hypothetical protein
MHLAGDSLKVYPKALFCTVEFIVRRVEFKYMYG